MLQGRNGRVFKEARCYVLQEEIPSGRIIVRSEGDKINLRYLDSNHVMERKGDAQNMLFIDGKMSYYISPTIWEELQILGYICRDDAAAALAAANAAASFAAPAASAADDAAASAAAAVFLKGSREFWEEVITGGVMPLDEVLDGIIVYNRHVSVCLNEKWVLPVNLSVSEEKLLKILNLVALFLQTKKVQVHWLIPFSLSFISALLEFSAKVRVNLYSYINAVFCYTLHLICDPMPRSWRRQVYSLGKWVENLKPENDIELKIQRSNVRAIIIAGSAKVSKEGAILVPSFINVAGRYKVLRCHPFYISCAYPLDGDTSYILAPTMISLLRVDCKSMDDYNHILTFIERMARNRCGSLKCYDGSKSKVSVRGLRESIISYVNAGLPPVYELELENVIVT